MRIEDVVNALNDYIKEQREAFSLSNKTFLVLHKSVTPHSTFKAYKHFEYSIWCIDKDFKYRWINHAKDCKAINQQEVDFVCREMEVGLCKSLFALAADGELTPIIDGRIKEWNNEITKI